MGTCNMASYNCVDRAASKAFYKYGKLISRHRLVFLISPCFVMLILSAGISQWRLNTDVEYLFTQEDCQSRIDEKYVQEHFQIGTEGGDFLPNRELELFQRRGRVIVTAADGKSMLRRDTIRDLLKLDKLIRTFNFTFNNTKFSHGEICQRFLGRCTGNQILKFYEDRLDEFENLTVTYPTAEIRTLFGQMMSIFIAPNLGGVEVDPNTDIVKHVKAIRLFYPLGTGPDDDNLAEVWEKEFLKVIDALQDEVSSIHVTRSTSVTFTQEVNDAAIVALPRFIATFCMLLVFAVCSCIMRDWVLSKPWLAFIGVISATFSIISAIGMLSIIGLEHNEVVSLMPFLILGVGVDNMFIMIAAWRQLSLYLSVEERTGRTYSEAGVSITITNLTTVLAFIIGASSSLPGVRTFCVYSGVAMFFVYFYQMTFFGAAMALFGEREANNLHCYTCKKVLPREESPNKLYLLFCSGGISRTNHKGYNIDLEHRIIKFFRLYYGPFITHRWVKALVVIFYMLYLSGTIYGLTQIEEGLVLKNLAIDNSPSYKFYDLEDVDFRKTGPAVSVIFKEEIPYWEEQVQDEIENLTKKFEALDMIFGEDLTQSWLRDFCRYWKAYNLYMPKPAPPGKEGFMFVLTKHFLMDPRYIMYHLDLEFEENKTTGEEVIKTSRFIVQTRNVFSISNERQLLLDVRELAASSRFDVIAFHPAFALYESYIGILPNLIQTLGIALGSMFLVAIIMIPHPVCAILVTLCVVSIDSSVMGYMALWGVNVDSISMVNIILCIGFSVDFSAHITYAFVVAPKSDANSRAQYALSSLGMAILQGALSSIIAISALGTAPVYIFRTFFKTLFLVMLFGALHGLIFLPVFLTFVSRFIPHKAPEEDICDEPVAVEQQTTAFLNTIPVKSTPGEGKIVDWRVTTV